MKKPTNSVQAAFILILALPFLLLCSCRVKKDRSKVNVGVAFQDDTTSLKPLFLKVKSEYDLAARHISPLIHLTEVDAVFDIANTYAVDGNVSVWVVKADYKRTTGRESILTFGLLDTTQQTPKTIDHSAIPDSDKLAKLIVNTTKKFVDIQNLTIASLKPQTFQIDVNYTVDNEGKIEVSPTIGKVGLDGSYDIDHKVVQTITLKFELKTPTKPK